ncbi:hypothetical protein C1I98_18930 [Spongiactinospora gelatinilytica]|uniref:Uncharacterized protein n=1 Tax=Spongiactinospora gelatinilytica TaxID=2666298 RepID=A0A2W2H0R5_9ACTN|nr:hypothetical protein [Spongiactinospora gelatinilytica]PZG43088.1 hypothetical protein C1I98_18930 [Spongiactinospora gelatinilytica]
MAILRRSSGGLEKRPIADAIAKRYPQLDREQTERFADEVVRQIAHAIRTGKNLAFIQVVDGEVQVDVISMVESVVGKAITR